MKRTALLLVVLTALALTAWAQQTQQPQTNRFKITTIEPDGFVGLRLGNSLHYAEDLLGEPDIVRKGSLEWHFRSADYDPYEALTALADKGQIVGFVAHVKANRVQFTDLNLHPEQNRFGTYHAKKRYVTGNYIVDMFVVGDDATFIRRIIMQSKQQ